MARRFLIIETGTDEAAELLKDYVQEVRVTDPSEPGSDMQVVGEFYRPDDFCDHGNWTTQPGKPEVTQIHLKAIGWRVCTKCNKPIPDMYLRNQIKPEDIENPEHEVIRGKDLGFYITWLGATSRLVVNGRML